jgi:hypothetical protein
VPVTPFHFGPGGLIAVMSRGYVSFLAFCAANVLIDFESLHNMVTRQPRIHTYLGATLAALVVVSGFYLLRWLTRHLPASPWTTWRRIPISAVIGGALFGAWSHVFLDSIMHGDITPFAPLSNSNSLYGVISLWTLHLSCVVAGAIALAWWWLRSDTSLDRTRGE